MSDAKGSPLKPGRLAYIVALGILAVHCVWVLALVRNLRSHLVAVLCFNLFGYGASLAVGALAISWKAQRGALRTVRTAAILACVALAMLVPAFFLGVALAKIDVSVSFRRGEAIYAEVMAFKERTGRCPKTLEDLERDIGHRLPRPVLDSGFYYSTDGTKCDIAVFTNGPRINTYMPDRGMWGGTSGADAAEERERMRHQQQAP